MSRKVTNILYKISSMATAPMTPRVRSKTKAALVSRINSDLTHNVETGLGDLKFLTNRGSNIAAAVSGFLNDEPETLQWIAGMKKGETFWDIGANIGLYSLYAGLRKDLDVYGFEPSALNYGLMAEHIVLNKLDKHVNALCIAFGEETALLKLYGASADAGHASNSVGEAANQFGEFEVSYEQMVPVYTMDDFCSQFDCKAPDHLKLDVDGLEANILRGGPKTLSKIGSLMIEIEGAQDRQDEILSLIKASGLTEQELDIKGIKARNRLFVRA